MATLHLAYFANEDEDDPLEIFVQTWEDGGMTHENSLSDGEEVDLEIETGVTFTISQTPQAAAEAE